MTERVRRAGEMGSRHGAAAVLVADPANRRWLGHSDTDGEVVLLCSGAVRTVARHEGEALDSTLEALGINRGALLGCDRIFASELPGYPCLDLSQDLAAARRCKEPEEVERIRTAARLASVGQEAVRGAAQAGVSELELWGVGQRAMTEEVRGTVGALIDLMVGERTVLIDSQPGGQIVEAGDPVLFDLAPEFQGYWGDSCGCFVVGEPSASLRRRHARVRAALEAGMEAARPGVEAREVDAAIRAELGRDGLECPHHTGHGVGTAPQESPWLIPGNAMPLEEGMTIAIEPGAYGEDFGVRLEHLVLIEADGARPLTTHSLNLSQGELH
jgi:Xaa-Pro aminopeptidase